MLHNVLYLNGDAASAEIRVVDATTSTMIHNNIIFPHQTAHITIWPLRAVAKLIIIFYGTQHFGPFLQVSRALSSHGKNGNQVAHTLLSPPLFLSPASGIYALDNSSNAIDRAKVLPGIDDNYLGNGPDIGWIESQ